MYGAGGPVTAQTVMLTRPWQVGILLVQERTNVGSYEGLFIERPVLSRFVGQPTTA